MITGLKTLLLFIVLLGFGGVFVQFYPRIYDVIIIAISVFLLIVNHGKIIYRMVMAFFVICMFFLIHAIITQTLFIKYFGIITKVFVAILIISGFRNDYHDIKLHLIRSIEIIVVLSSINYILVQFPFFFKTVSNEGYGVRTFFYIFNYLEHAVYYLNGVSFVRNQGPYWEPGILQALMNILIYYRLIECNSSIKKTKWPIFVLLSTFSTTGYILFILILIYKFKKIIIANTNIIKIAIIFFTIVLFLPLFIGEINNKFFGRNAESSALRMYDFYMGIRVSLNNFWTGAGYDFDNYYNEIKHLTVEINGKNMAIERGNTNSIATLFFVFGMPVGLYIIFMLYRQNIFSQRKFIFLCFFIILLSEPLVITYFVMLFLLSVIKKRDKIIA
jgi:hypothetical protein